MVKKTPLTHEIENETIKEKILEIHHLVNKIYGFRRITMTINYQMNNNYNYKKNTSFNKI